MPTPIKIKIGTLELSAELNDSPTAKKLTSLLPLEFSMSRWGDEYYGDCGIKTVISEDARDVMEAGELAVWPTGNDSVYSLVLPLQAKGTNPGQSLQ